MILSSRGVFSPGPHLFKLSDLALDQLQGQLDFL